MDLDTVDESPVSNRTASCARETGRGDTIEILTKMAQRELRRREDGIFQYVNKSAAKKTSCLGKLFFFTLRAIL
ncbi:hypothetical protein N7449_010541 [Penicillium cf. viridicatum]|uniref:Uncharacterized protein n=1 Tax=Penicillium cf. viridicatum TaxID=2972119 RepID=A0A9W9J0H0_9EURO|nr:hypothetical protein N7449_010541 [Penicillium cf. viridicatum]